MSEFQYFEGKFSNGNLSATESPKPQTDGNGSYYENINTLNLNPKIELTGHVTEPQMVSLSLKPEVVGLCLGGVISGGGALVLTLSGNLADGVLLTGPFTAAVIGLLSIKFITNKYGFK